MCCVRIGVAFAKSRKVVSGKKSKAKKKTQKRKA